MSDRISPLFTTIDGLSIRFAASAGAAQGRQTALLLSPWPESVYASSRCGIDCPNTVVIAVDPPGFGQSEYRAELMNPQAMGRFIIRMADAFDLAHRTW